MPCQVAPDISIVPSEVLQEAIICADRRLQQSIFEPNFSVPSMMFEYLWATLDKKVLEEIHHCGEVGKGYLEVRQKY